MENFNSHINKILGPDEDKEKIVEKLQGFGVEKIDSEIEKTPRDIEIIDFSQKCLNEYLIELGSDNIYNVGYESIHLVPVGGTNKFKKGEVEEGVASSLLGSCVVDRKENDINFSIVLFHELFHLKDFTSIEKTQEENLYDGYANRRSGIGVMVKEEKYFDLINETLNDYLCQKFFKEKIKNSDLFDKKEIEEYVFDSPRVKSFSSFEGMLDELLEKNKDEFSSREEIKRLFFDADINGNLLPVARLIEKTYGNGSFRRLGEYTKK